MFPLFKSTTTFVYFDKKRIKKSGANTGKN